MVAIYTLTSILSAFLVFFIQPVVAKIALPTLGGVPAVWNGCMLFFQATLLCGYLYANVLTNRVPLKSQPIVHLVLLFAALLVFPMGFVGREEIDPSLEPMSWLLWMLAYSVGIPFFVISATAPLLQRWFSHTNHKDAANPYFLYAASNIGSMSALLLYPFVVEPFFALSQQVEVWEAGVTFLAFSFVGVSVFLWRRSATKVIVEPVVKRKANLVALHGVRWGQRGKWVVYSAVPASLLYGVTTYLTTDIAPIPFLWVLPLALYLITFIIVFSSRENGGRIVQTLHVPAVALLVLLLAINANSLPMLALHVIVYFIVVLSVHYELSRSKPEALHLTEFFLWMSIGGVLGGVFNTLVAPHIFNDIHEYPLALLLSCLLLPMGETFREQMRRQAKLLGSCALLVLIFALVFSVENGAVKALHAMNDDMRFYIFTGLLTGFVCAIAFAFMVLRTQPIAMVSVLATAYVVFSGFLLELKNLDILFQGRSIFAVYEVEYSPQEKVYRLTHGRTVHGVQSAEEDKRLHVGGYYNNAVPYLRASGENKEQKRVALIGLGIGILNCAGEAGDQYDIFEIDPLMYQVASDTRFFSYLEDCPPNETVIIGDGRMQVSRQPEDYYDALLIDAFNSDAVPVHLITKEAVGMYLKKMTAEAPLLIHVSNRYIDLRPALSTIGHHFEGVKVFSQDFKTQDETHDFSSTWVAMTRGEAMAKQFAADGWTELEFDNPDYLWTDSYSNIFTSLRFLKPLEKAE